MNSQPLDTPPPAEVGEPEPDALDKLIAEKYPKASPEVRLAIRARAEKRQKRLLRQHEHRARPSIADSFANSPTLWHLTALRETVMLGLSSGHLDADKRTVERWEDAMWSRLLFFLASAPTINEAMWVVNHSFTWPKPDHVQKLLDALAEQKFKSFP